MCSIGVRSLTAGRLADLVIDVSAGATAPIGLAVDMVRPKGMIVLAGLKDGAPVNVVSDRIVLKQLTLQGVGGHDSASVTAALRLIASGRYSLEKLCTHTFPLAETERALGLVGRQATGEESIHITLVPSRRDCRFSPQQPLDTAPEKMGPTRGERIFGSFCGEVSPFTPSSRLLLAAYRGAHPFIDSL